MMGTLSLRKGGLRFKEIDLVITATATCTFHFPSLATFGFRLSYHASLSNNIDTRQIPAE